MAERDFESYTPEELRSVVQLRRDVVLRVPAAVAGVGDVALGTPAPDLPTHREFPPMPSALEPKAAAEIFAHSDDGAPGRWMRFIETSRWKHLASARGGKRTCAKRKNAAPCGNAECQC